MIKYMKKIKRNYISYDYENTFIDPLERANEQLIENLLKVGAIKSVYATKTIRSGNQFEIEIYPEFTKKQAKDLNLRKKNRQAQKNLNEKNARKKVERLINNNFKKGDLFVHLTYDDKHLPSSLDEALKNMRNFIRRINYKRKKMGLDKAKYIYVTEHDEDKKIRCHHHLIIDSGLDMDTVESMWKYGSRNKISKCDPDKDGLTGLANYLVKDPKGKKRWCSSTNLKKPRISKSYYRFKGSHVKKMIKNRASVKEMAEKQFKNYVYSSDQIRYNEINCKFYIYIRMRERRNL